MLSLEDKSKCSMANKLTGPVLVITYRLHLKRREGGKREREKGGKREMLERTVDIKKDMATYSDSKEPETLKIQLK